MPGDKCEGGYNPPSDKIVNLKKKCQAWDKSVIEEELKPSYVDQVSGGTQGASFWRQPYVECNRQRGPSCLWTAI